MPKSIYPKVVFSKFKFFPNEYLYQILYVTESEMLQNRYLRMRSCKRECGHCKSAKRYR